MSVRGGRPTARGRGRGRGARTMIWGWQRYTPAPEVYDSLFRIRKAPGTIVPSLPTECPIPNALSRIIRRQQTEDEFKRHFYVVQIIHTASNDDDRTSQDNRKEKTKEEIIHVDTMSIRNYVSLHEIERFENAEFKAEAEADAAAARFEAEELAQRYLARNAKTSGIGRGSRMLSGLGLDPDSQAGTSGRGGGRARGRGRGRGRRRGRGAYQTRNDKGTHIDHHALNHENEDDAMQIEVVETEDEESSDNAQLAQQSSALPRSSFITNSALSLSPIIVPKHLPLLRKTPDEELDRGSSKSMLSPSAQLQFEWQGSLKRASEDHREEDEEDQHRGKRQRTESEQPAPSKLFPPLPRGRPKQPSKIHDFEHSGSESSSYSDDPLNPNSVKPICNPLQSELQHETQDHEQAANQEEEDASDAIDEDEAQDEDTEEYVVEAIINHNFDRGLRYYLVEWEGYEGSTDWLEESELQGAREAIRDYHKRLKMRGMHSGKRK